MKKKLLVFIAIVLVAGIGAFGYRTYYEAEQRKLAEEQRIEAEKKEKEEAQKKAVEEKERLEKIKAHLAAEEAQKVKEKAAAEEVKKREAEKAAAEKAAEQPAAEQEAEKTEILVTQPQAVSPLTMTGSKKEVTEKAKVVEQKQPEAKVEPKPVAAAPTEDIKEHSEAERNAEEAAKTNPDAEPVNQSGNGIANSNSPDNPFNHLDYSGAPQDWSKMTKGIGYDDMATGDKF